MNRKIVATKHVKRFYNAIPTTLCHYSQISMKLTPYIKIDTSFTALFYNKKS